jgi:N-methylhydantoinase A
VYRIGIDVGGTFTDFVVAKEGEAPRYFKTPSVPRDPSEAIVAGLQEAAAGYGLTIDDLLAQTALVIHGTTTATNTLVERKGARVGLLTTQGFRDLLEMREGVIRVEEAFS